jgi:hypothetical protein
MQVPGSNLLAMALGVIGPQTITLYRAVSRAQNPKGDWVTTFAAGYPVEGSWQPVDSRKYAELGLDLKRKYFNFYTSELIEGADRGRAADQCARDGRRYETVGDTPWRTVDGWQAAMFVDVGADV